MATTNSGRILQAGWRKISLKPCSFRQRSIPLIARESLQQDQHSIRRQSFTTSTVIQEQDSNTSSNSDKTTQNLWTRRKNVRIGFSSLDELDTAAPSPSKRPSTTLTSISTPETAIEKTRQNKSSRCRRTRPYEPTVSIDPYKNIRKLLLTFEDRLGFLDGRAHEEELEQISNNSIDTTKSTTTTTSRRRKILNLRKRYRPGYKPGDFICPQCGSHNFRPPERNASISIDQSRHQNESVTISSRRGTGEQTSLSSSLESMDATSSKTVIELKHNTAESSSSLSINDRVTVEVPQRKYPIGAKSHCYECGYKTSYDISSLLVSKSSSSSSSSSLSSSSSSLPQDLNHSKQGKTLVELTKNVRQDIRVVKPRDYVCPRCRSLNYNSRMYCVGCGILAPWIRDKAASSYKRITSRSHSHSHSHSSNRSKERVKVAGDGTETA